MKYLIGISIFIILVCLFIQNNDGFKEGLTYNKYQKILLQINIVESVAANAITSINSDSNFAEYSWHILNLSETNIDKMLILTNIFIGLNDTNTNKSIMVNNIPQPISNIILLFQNQLFPIYKEAQKALTNIRSYTISDENIISILNYSYGEFNDLEKIALIQNYIKHNIVTQTPAHTSSLVAPTLAPSSVAPSSVAPALTGSPL